MVELANFLFQFGVFLKNLAVFLQKYGVFSLLSFDVLLALSLFH